MIYKDIYVMHKHIMCLRKKITNFVPFMKIIIFDVSPGFNQTNIKVKKKNNYNVDENNVDVKIINVPKWISILHGNQWKL